MSSREAPQPYLARPSLIRCQRRTELDALIINMETDIDTIMTRLATVRPDIRVTRLKVSHKADDDGIWFFSAGGAIEVQLESTTGNFPFLVESTANERRTTVNTVDQAIGVICSELAGE
jgi:hypothetical protein